MPFGYDYVNSFYHLYNDLSIPSVAVLKLLFGRAFYPNTKILRRNFKAFGCAAAFFIKHFCNIFI